MLGQFAAYRGPQRGNSARFWMGFAMYMGYRFDGFTLS